MHTLSQPSARLFTSTHPAFKTKKSLQYPSMFPKRCVTVYYIRHSTNSSTIALYPHSNSNLYVFLVNDRISFLWQHGRGTHVWILKQADGSQYFLSNRYTGDFVQGQRHGQGTFYFANGAIYEGEWSNNKSHAKVNPRYSIASHSLYTHVHKFSKNPERK